MHDLCTFKTQCHEETWSHYFLNAPRTYFQKQLRKNWNSASRPFFVATQISIFVTKTKEPLKKVFTLNVSPIS